MTRSQPGPPGRGYPAAPAQRGRSSLAKLILAGDRDALSEFFDAREPKVRSFCAEACPAELIDYAGDAARVDFIGRLRTTGAWDVELLDLDDLLLKATRSAAAGCFRVEAPPLIDEAWQRKWTERPTDEATCQAMPELLAGDANGELTAGQKELRRHVQVCPTCQDTVARVQRAERAFAQTSGFSSS